MQSIEDSVAAGVFSLGVLDQFVDMVFGIQRNRNKRRCNRTLALAHLIESGLEFMHKVGDCGKAEHRARALDGVQCPEG